MAISKEFAIRKRAKGVTVKCGAEGGGRPNSNAQADGWYFYFVAEALVIGADIAKNTRVTS